MTESMGSIPTGPYKLVEHPWDAIGEPPRPGGAYPQFDWATQREKIEKLVKEAEGYYEEYDEAINEAQEHANAAEEALNEAENIVMDEIEEVDPGTAADLVKMIEAKHRNDIAGW